MALWRRRCKALQRKSYYLFILLDLRAFCLSVKEGGCKSVCEGRWRAHGDSFFWQWLLWLFSVPYILINWIAIFKQLVTTSTS